MTLRRADFSLNEEQGAVRSAFRTAFERSCPIERVEAAAAADLPGYDEKVWRQLLDMRIVAMGVPEAAGGDGAGLTELVLVAEQQGAFLAPVPLVEAVVSARLLARCGDAWVGDAIDGNRLATVALHPCRDGRAQLVPAGAIADGVIGLAATIWCWSHETSRRGRSLTTVRRHWRAGTWTSRERTATCWHPDRRPLGSSKGPSPNGSC